MACIYHPVFLGVNTFTTIHGLHSRRCCNLTQNVSEHCFTSSLGYMMTCAYELRHCKQTCAKIVCSILALYMFTGKKVWRQYTASVCVKPYPAKQCSSAHSHHDHQSSHCITFAKPCQSLVSCAFYTIHILPIFNSENFYLLV